MRSRASREAPSNSTQLPRKNSPPPKCRQALTDIRGKVKKKNRTIEKVKQQQQSDLCWQELSGLPISGPRLKGCSPETHWPWRPASWDPGSPAGTGRFFHGSGFNSKGVVKYSSNVMLIKYYKQERLYSIRFIK